MAKQRYVVQCKTHCVESKDWAGRQVVVPAPKAKRDRREGGCPFCRQAERLERAEGK